MQHHIQTLVKHIFRKESLQEVTVNQLQQFIDSYPYSAVGQLLLAKKLHETGAQNFDEQAGKTTLYFHDAVWAGWVMRQDGAPVTDESIDAMFGIAPAVNERPHFIFNNTNTVSPEAETMSNDTPPWEETSAPENVDVEIANSPQEPVIDNAAQEWVDDRQENREEVSSSINEAGDSEGSIEQTLQQPSEWIESPQEQVEANETTGEHSNSTSQPAAESSPSQAPQPAVNEGSSFSEPQPAAPKEELTFEPYHTIDYFASLGIKLKPEDLAKDKLGQQLKSFTDWLRSMKKVGPTQSGTGSPAEVDEFTDKSIQKIAEFSNEAKEIITEAMAEVWAKQGHREKAVAIYEKLSLLNPSKSPYFAARIEALKS